MDDDAQKQDSLQENQTEITSGDQSQAIILLNLESLVKGHIASIDQITDGIKKQNEMLVNVLENDPTYKQHDEQAKSALKVKMATKSQIMKQPSVTQVTSKLKDLRSQLKDLKSELSEYLLEYQRLANTDQIEGDDGQLRIIINSAKLVKRSS